MTRTILAVTAALLAFAMAARAQGPVKVYRVAYISTRAGSNLYDRTLFETLREFGYVEGKNLNIDYRWGVPADRVAAACRELVQTKPDLIVAASTVVTRACKEATRTIPLVFPVSSDPVGAGLVVSLAHPGGNVTGLTFVSTDLAGKDLELLAELVPKAARAGALIPERIDTTFPGYLRELETATKARGLTLHVFRYRGAQDFETVFGAMKQERIDGVVVKLSPESGEHFQQVVDLAARHRLPAVYESRIFVDAGGRILSGERPANLPVEQPTILELVVNAKAAKRLGLTVPASLRLRADEVIEK